MWQSTSYGYFEMGNILRNILKELICIITKLVDYFNEHEFRTLVYLEFVVPQMFVT